MARALETLKEAVPWYAKIAAKIVLSRLPLPYAFWQRLRLFRWGTMDNPHEAVHWLKGVLANTGLGPRLDGLAVLELGPGDALTSAVVARLLGARSVTLVDAGDFARRDFAPYRALLDGLARDGTDISALAGATSLDDLLARCRARYLTEGVKSLAALEPGSIDVVMSRAVLEHVRASEFLPTLRALRRAMAPGAIGFHAVDLQDHLAHALNNLRFSERVWESAFMTRSGFYTNRIRYSAMLDAFRAAGFAVEVLRAQRFARLPTPRRALAPAYRALDDDELMIAGFDVLLRPAQ